MTEEEDYALLLDQLRQAYQEVIPRFGGTMVQISTGMPISSRRASVPISRSVGSFIATTVSS